MDLGVPGPFNQVRCHQGFDKQESVGGSLPRVGHIPAPWVAFNTAERQWARIHGGSNPRIEDPLA